MALKFIGERTVGTLNGMKSGFVKDDLYRVYDAGILVPGGVSVDHGDFVSWDGTKWVREADIKIARSDEITNTNSSIAPEYTKTTYPANSYVMYGGVLYTNPNAIGTAEDWNPAHWTQTTVAEMMAGAGGGGYTEKTINFSSGPYDIEVKQKEVITAVISGTWTGEANIILDDDCNDAVIFLQRSPGNYTIDLSDVVVKKGAETIPIFGQGYITDAEFDSCFGVTSYYVNTSNRYSSFLIEIKGKFAVVHTD